MPQYDFDLFTLGAGSGGVAASRRAGSYGARVAICEDNRIGGTWVHRGCVPKKLLVYGAHFREELEDAAGFGWALSEPGFDTTVGIHPTAAEEFVTMRDKRPDPVADAAGELGHDAMEH